MFKMNHPSLRRALLVLGMIAAGCVIAACGSSSSSSSSSSSGSQPAASTGGSASARRAALQACLQKHGVTLPARPGGGRGFFGGGPPQGGTGTTGQPNGGGFFRNPKVQSAMRACGANFGGRFRGRGVSRQAVSNYVTCVRQHGYNMPNPNFSGRGPIFPANIRTDPKFQAASRQCQSLLVRPRGGSTTPSA